MHRLPDRPLCFRYLVSCSCELQVKRHLQKLGLVARLGKSRQERQR
jgi:hypothetical protein